MENNDMNILDELLNTFEEKFEAAEHIHQSDEQMTNADIINLFNTASDIDVNALFTTLKERGFVCKIIDRTFYWLLKNRQQ